MDGAGLLGGGAAAVCASMGILAYAVRVPSSAMLAPSVYKGSSARRAIALTFDDGPSESTPELLEILARHNVPATFFQCGANVRRLPRISRQVASGGHEIGNHTDTHPRLYLRSRQFIEGELARAQETIEQTAGVRPRLFRAPYGARWFGLRQAQQRLGLLGVMWTTLALDWKWPESRVVQRLLDGVRNGAIFCLHDGRRLEPRPDIRATLGAVREVLPKLMEQGFHFEKVTDILCPTPN
uniref:Polysaccharide deacetylase n=1 Tax=uncultured Acidobacteriota bacterium TaxID=171953 RepID=G8DPM1_9BACT|nr:polysaccharide deacetylase [uncultured Acidobacteriota bacterium]